MTWENVCPNHIAVRQYGWERGWAILRAIEAGATQVLIAEKIGVTPPRIHQIVEKFRRIRDRGRPVFSPFQQWLFDVSEREKSDLARFANNLRAGRPVLRKGAV